MLDILAQMLCRSVIFIFIYHMISYHIEHLKRKNIFSTMTLFKIELLLHVAVKIWVLLFVSLSHYDKEKPVVGEHLGRN